MSVFQETEDQQRARRIMGRNFIGIGEVMQHFGARYTDGWLAHLATIPFYEGTLEEYKHTHVLFPGYPYTIQDIRDSGYEELFHTAKRPLESMFLVVCVGAPWNIEYVVKARVDPCWFLIRRDPVPDSTQKYLWQQKLLLSRREAIPRVCEVVYMTILTYLVTGERLFKDVYVRCSDAMSCSDVRFLVGGFNSRGLSGFPGSDTGHCDGMGLAVMVQPKRLVR
jgi:hypothetical protein